MKTKTEPVLVIRNSRDEVVGIVHKDTKSQKNLVYVVSNAKIEQIADLMEGKYDEPYIKAEK